MNTLETETGYATTADQRPANKTERRYCTESLIKVQTSYSTPVAGGRISFVR